MNDYISREAAIKAVEDFRDNDPWEKMRTMWEKWRRRNYCEIALKGLTKLPAADVRPVVRGEWVIKESPLTKCKTVICSRCGYRETRGPGWEKSWGTPSFCECCGADMRGGNDNGKADIQE